ncbi:11459_t:CDS:2, partial [Racocetra persica]
MQLWVEQVIGGQMFLTDLIIKEKAAFFAWALDLPDSLYGEANNILIEIFPEKRMKFCELIKEYLLENIFNADKMG